MHHRLYSCVSYGRARALRVRGWKVRRGAEGLAVRPWVRGGWLRVVVRRDGPAPCSRWRGQSWLGLGLGSGLGSGLVTGLRHAEG
eukprot:scaffold8936_cov61-Phaeocystis_antarctica.AAC.5